MYSKFKIISLVRNILTYPNLIYPWNKSYSEFKLIFDCRMKNLLKTSKHG